MKSSSLHAGRQPDGREEVVRGDLPERDHEQDRERLTFLQSSRSFVVISFTNCMSNCSEEGEDELAGEDFAEGSQSLRSNPGYHRLVL